MKRCAWCKKKKSVKEFRKHGPRAAKKHGKYYRICKSCSREHGEVNHKRYEMLASGYGWCSKCHQWKGVDEFHKSLWNTTGITNQCIRCISDNPDKLDRRLSREEMFQKGFKWCAPCAQWKKLEEFSKNKCKRDGLGTVCKKCFGEISAVYSEKNRDKKAEYERTRREKKPEEFKKKEAHYRKTHKDIVNAATHRHRAKIKKMDGGFDASQWKKLVDFYSPNNECLRCKRTDRKLTRDHVDPSGTNYISNIQPLCGSCNSGKHDTHFDYRSDGGEYARSLV